MGLTRGSYEAYCFNEAVWYCGATIDGEVNKAGQKPSKEERRTTSAREKVLEKYLGSKKPESQRFADPAVLFQ